MKKALVASILGLVVTAVSSFGQGQVFFNNYVGSVYQPIRYGNPAPQGGVAGQTVSAGFKADLYYGLGSGLSFNALSIVPGSTTTVGSLVAGYITGGIVTIPGYVSGPVTFAIVCYNGADWASTRSSTLPTAAATLLPPQGQPIPTWTEPSIASGLTPAGQFTVNVPAVLVALPVPEPSILALAGLGALALIRRRK